MPTVRHSGRLAYRSLPLTEAVSRRRANVTRPPTVT